MWIINSGKFIRYLLQTFIRRIFSSRQYFVNIFFIICKTVYHFVLIYPDLNHFKQFFEFFIESPYLQTFFIAYLKVFRKSLFSI